MALLIKPFSTARTKVERHSDLSDPNAALTVTVPKGSVRRILFVTVKWSSSVTKDVVITLKSGLGSAYDIKFETISLVPGTDGIWFPTGNIILADDDSIEAVSDAGGGAVTAAIAIYTEVV